jgi:hypothetical protein
MKCDFCRIESELVMICAFGENGVTLHLHPWCADELSQLPSDQQDALLKNATHRTDFASGYKTV